MNWRHFVGSSTDRAVQFLLRSLTPTRHFPAGHYYAFDIKRFYRLRKIDFQTVIDAGANTGQTCVPLTSWFPSARIYSFEPVLGTFEKLVRNTSSHKNIRCFNCALSDREGTQIIPLMRDSELNSLAPEPALERQSTGAFEEVRLITLDHFCKAEGIQHIDLLKLDVQGHELQVLRGAGDLLSRVGFILTEVGFQEKQLDVSAFSSLHDFLRDRNFFFCGVYDSFRHWDAKLLVSFGNALYCNTKSFESPDLDGIPRRTPHP